MQLVCRCMKVIRKKLETSWPKSASELYRTSERRLSAKLVPVFAVRSCHIVSVTDPHRKYSRFSRLELLLFFFKYLLNCTLEAEWTPFQTHYSSENLVAPVIEPRPLDP
jgi:hypothetical protein